MRGARTASQAQSRVFLCMMTRFRSGQMVWEWAGHTGPFTGLAGTAGDPCLGTDWMFGSLGAWMEAAPVVERRSLSTAKALAVRPPVFRLPGLVTPWEWRLEVA